MGGRLSVAQHFRTRYDAVIVGMGMAGLLAAYRLLLQRPQSSVLLIDAGLPLEDRLRLAPGGMAGHGGAGMFLGGRLYLGSFTIPVRPPGTLPAEMSILLEGAAYDARAEEVESFLLSLGGEAPIVPEPGEQLRRAVTQAADVGIDYITSYPARHLPADQRRGILDALLRLLREHDADVLFRSRVTGIERAGSTFALTLAPDLAYERELGRPPEMPERVEARALVLAPGRYGTEWLVRVAGGLGARTVALPSAFGVRVELRAATYAPLTSVTPDPRLQRPLENDALIKTYATCPGGIVVPVERYNTLVASGMPLFGEQRRENTTFAVLVQPGAAGAAGVWQGGDAVARALNERAPGRLIVQRLGDVRARRPSTEASVGANSVRPSCASASPGQIFDVYPFAYWEAFEDFLGRIESLAPGAASDDALVYGPAEERFWYFPTDRLLQSNVAGLFVAGDAPGQSQGVIQAGVAGVLAGEGAARYLA